MSFVDFMIKYGLMILSIVATIASLIVAWVKAKRTGNTKSLLSIVERIPSLVTTAESLFGSGKGSAKLDYVLTQLRLYALQQNVKVDVEDLTAQINSVVDATKNVNVVVTEKPSTTEASNESRADADNSTIINQDFINI
jgi:hypothetical protein